MASTLSHPEPSFALKDVPSALMRQAGPYLGMLAAGSLLAEHDLRVLPTSSAPNTLRLEPSAYIADADVEHCLIALTQLCTIIRNANAGRLIRQQRL